MKFTLLLTAVTASVILLGCGTTGEDDGMMEMMKTEYKVTITVKSESMTPLAPVVWAVHTGGNPFLQEEMDKKPEGLEELAEDGAPDTANQALAALEHVKAHGIASVPSGSSQPGPAVPGNSYSFSFAAQEGEKLSFATMYVQSNDLFFSPGKMGIPLYEMKKPIAGCISELVMLYDAGTEKKMDGMSYPETGDIIRVSISPVKM